MAFVYGIYYPDEGGTNFEASYIDFPGRKPDFHQETDTISRMIYGMASAYMLTGEDRFLEVAEKGTKYLRDHMRFYDIDENIVYWYHGIDVQGDKEHKLFTSEFDDDIEAIPMYEQIYALAGPTQTYRLNGDPAIMKDIRMTISLFDKFFIDREKGGYYSHIDPVTFDPKSDSLGRNVGRKNWNSVGDHAPAYLINLQTTVRSCRKNSTTIGATTRLGVVNKIAAIGMTLWSAKSVRVKVVTVSPGTTEKLGGNGSREFAQFISTC